jgi:hypothetical protein
MRLWSLHPGYLDAKGLVALWREALLAQKVLGGSTQGYRSHPQLDRFKRLRNPAAAIALYLQAIHEESVRRGYRFDRSKIGPRTRLKGIPVTSGQLAYELKHLKSKLKSRDMAAYARIAGVTEPRVHPLFVEVVSDTVEEWEIV